MTTRKGEAARAASQATAKQARKPRPSALEKKLRAVFTGLARSEFCHMTMRQLGTLYATDTPKTVRGLADDLDCPKPSMTRALQRLAEMGLVDRTVDETDLRSNDNMRSRDGDKLIAMIESF